MKGNKTYLVRCGKLYDGYTDMLQLNMEILVKEGLIIAVGRNIHQPADAEVIDLSNLTVTPGLIDAHIHSDIWDWREYFAEMYAHGDDWKTLAHLHTAQRTLERGFTTIRCHAASSVGFGVVDVKKMINQGYFRGSRLCVTGHLLGSEGGHADNGQHIAGNPALGLMAQAPNIGTGVSFFRRAVRNEVKYGADFIKIFLSGGFSSPNDGPEEQQLSDEELECIIRTARELKVPTTAHVYSSELIQKLIKYGITGIEHGSLMDKETVDMMEKSNIYLVPTMGCYDEIIHGNEDKMRQRSPEYQRKLRQYAKQLRASRELIVHSNMRLGYGSDYVSVFQCYDSWHEYECMMKSGMDAFRILKAATSVNAEILGMQDEIGSIEPGKYADLAGWHRDLLTDPQAISQCDFVMKGGIIYPTVYAQN